MSMRIIIPTRGRVGKQTTFSNLPKTLRDKTTIVCPAREAKQFRSLRSDWDILEQENPDFTIAQKRKWIVEWARKQGHDRVIMLDDDMYFFVKRTDDVGLLRKAESDDVQNWFGELFGVLGPDIPHVGAHSRMGSQSWTPGWRVGRCMYLLGYYLPVVLENAEFGRIETREDMDVTLQLLRAGYPCAVTTTFVTEQLGGWGSGRKTDVGGCHGQRTVESSNADADRLAELHPGLVRVVEKKYKDSVPRREVVCSWEKALQEGQQRRFPGGVRDEDRAPGVLGRSPAVHRPGK